jgi:hypothetical protein
MITVDEYVASKIVALREFREFWQWNRQNGSENHPERIDNWDGQFDIWLAREDVQRPTNPYTPHVRHAHYNHELDKLLGLS